MAAGEPSKGRSRDRGGVEDDTCSFYGRQSRNGARDELSKTSNVDQNSITQTETVSLVPRQKSTAPAYELLRA